MKRFIIVLLLIPCAMALLCGIAFADGSGIHDIQTEENVAVVPQLANGDSVAANSSGYYIDAKRMELTYSGTPEAGADYLVMVLEGDAETPSVDNIVYMDQYTATDTDISFNIYPKQLTEGMTYHIYLSDNSSTSDGLSEIASFQYRTFSNALLGDANGDSKLSVADAVVIKRAIANQSLVNAGKDPIYTTNLPDTDQKLANADANGDGKLSVADAVVIHRTIANQSLINAGKDPIYTTNIIMDNVYVPAG